MPATPNSVAVDLNNRIITAAQTFSLLKQQLTDLNQLYVSNAVANTTAAFPTCATNTDGTLGTADGTPSTDVGHVIDTRVTGLSRATTAYNLGAMLNILQQFLNLVNGQAVATQASAVDLIAEFNGG